MNLMLFVLFLHISVFMLLCVESRQTIKEQAPCFPPGFKFGTASASYQIEGAWNVSGKTESIWDHYVHKHPDRVFDHKNGDVACDSYHLYQRDVQMLVELKVAFYRFSLSWTRILPNGFSNEINKDGIRYYNALIDELIAHNITPIVTMYHWDLPQSLQELGGWTNPIMADYFTDYARVVFETFGDKVKNWITLNEPLTFCRDGYAGYDAPGHLASGVEDYMCGHNALRAHAKAYRLYDTEYRHKFGGNVGITLDTPWIEPASNSEKDQLAAETGRQFLFGWFAHPIFSTEGGYPPIMRQRIDEISRRQNFSRSRLPTFTAAEENTIKGSADFLGLNHYTTLLASRPKQKIPSKPSFDSDMGVTFSRKSEWPKTNSTWLRVVPWGFRKLVNWIKNSYNNPLVFVTENGMSLEPGLQDNRRIDYISSYLKSLHDAIVKDHCRVVGYTYWSLMDNFEWMRGFSERFGLYEVNYDTPEKTRTPRISASYYANISSTGCIPDPTLWYDTEFSQFSLEGETIIEIVQDLVLFPSKDYF